MNQGAEVTKVTKEEKHTTLNIAINQLDGLKYALERLLSRISSGPCQDCDKKSDTSNISLQETLETGSNRIDDYRESMYKLIEEISTALF